MNIRDAGAYLGSLWDWTRFNHVFGRTGIRISDIDGVVERRGHILYIETKAPDEDVPTGQRRLHDAWLNNGDMVLIVWGHKNAPQRAQLRMPDSEVVYDYFPVTKMEQVLTWWFQLADAAPKGQKF